MKNLREKVLQGDTLLGCWLNLGNPLTAEIIGKAGFDWVLIDLEHGAGFERDVLPQLQALEHTGAAPIVRVESCERQRSHRVLDLGASGIMFPRVNTVEEARSAVAAMRYPPHGVRGVAFANRACDFGAGFRAYLDNSLTSLLCVVQVETPEAVANIDEIAALEGVDVLFVGPSDLSQSLGMLGQFDHPRFKEAIESVAAAARKHGKACGILLPKPDDLTYYRDLGYRFLASGSDGTLLANSARSHMQNLRQMAQSKAAGEGA